MSIHTNVSESQQSPSSNQTLDCDSQSIAQGLLTVEQALNNIFKQVQPTSCVESVPLALLNKRVLAQDIRSTIAVPPFDNSAMDGYAVNSAHFDDDKVFDIRGTAFAGAPFEGELGPKQCVRIMTGGQMPEGADAVIMQENATLIGSQHKQVSFSMVPIKGLAVRYSGEDIQKDSCVLKKGHIVRPIDIGLLASLGIASADVFESLTVGIISTGDELMQPGTILKPGQIYDSNRFVLEALLLEQGHKVINFGVINDDLDALKIAFKQAAEQVDVMLTSGGVSVGDADYTKDVLAELGEVGFWKIAMKPGKPLAFGRLGKSVFIGLPGNPVSSVVTFQQIAQPTLRFLSGAIGEHVKVHRAVIKETFKKRPGRTDFQRGFAETDAQGQLTVIPLAKQNSGVLSSLAQANCYVVLPQHRANMVAGELVDIQFFSEF